MKSLLNFTGFLLFVVNVAGQSTPDLELEKLKWQQQQNQSEQEARRSTEEATQRIQGQMKKLEDTYKQVQDQAYQKKEDDPFKETKKTINEGYKASDGAPTIYDPPKENLDRFTNSPCYQELGFIPGRDNERLYRECEGNKSSFGGGVGNSYLYALGGLAGIILFLIIINHFQKRGGK